ncbi:MAG: CBS domain-containing protein, partial [Candidatus Acidiferrales bacterium]
PLDQLDTVILINTHAVFVGTVSVTKLMLAEKDQRMAALVNEPLVSVGPQTDEKEVFELFDKYNLRSLTVVNVEQQPIGAITVDDIVSRMHAKLG